MNFVQPASERCGELLHADCGAGVGHSSYPSSYAVAVLFFGAGLLVLCTKVASSFNCYLCLCS
jgi:hypothetical protein